MQNLARFQMNLGRVYSQTGRHQLALKSALSAKAAEQQIRIVDAFNMEAPKTREMDSILGNLNAIFFMKNRLSRDPGVTDPGVQPRPIYSVGVLGTGLMGSGIAAAHARVPSFSRQTGLPCSACHYQFAQLTPFGRLFKLNGYTLVGLKPITESLTHDRGMVVSKRDGSLLAESHVEGRPSVNDLATLLAHAMRRPLTGTPHRPRRIHVRGHP